MNRLRKFSISVHLMSNNLLLSAHQKLPAPRETGGFSTEVFLHGLKDEIHETGSDVDRIIDRLCKKVEVPRRLVIGYSDDLNNTADYASVAPEYATYFTLLLLIYASENNDLKFLNCALKIVDGYLRGPQVLLTNAIRDMAVTAVKKLL